MLNELNWREAPEMDAEIDKSSWEGIVLPPETISGIRNSFERFFERREEYRRFGFPWRRGILFVGPTGTGKTTVVKALAASRPEVPFLYVRDLDPFGVAGAIARVFAKARALAPSILALEDVDGLVNGSNRTLFLNELDGFANNEGVLVVASSNHPERIDEALLKRPSRFDRVFHLGMPGLEEREVYLRRLLSLPHLAERFASEGEFEESVGRLAERTEGLSPAHIKEAVLSAALGLAEGGGEPQEGSEPDGGFDGRVLAQAELLKAYLRSARSPEDLAKPRAPGRALGFG
jgi:SpoVK/Ycf46/Vps4 family AAA+-type ATPase